MNKRNHIYSEQAYLERLQSLLPPVSYDRNGEQMVPTLTVEARLFNRINAHGQRVLNAITPHDSNELIADWERMLGIPIDFEENYQFRVNRVLQKLAEVGGLSIPYFINLAKKLGYEITIIEGDDYIFRSGENRVGDRIGRLDQMWVWYVNVQSSYTEQYYFRAGSARAGERLLTIRDPIIEEIFNDLKPAHTLCIFNYS
ncbi:YmfQ family protein [Ignatzschineria cameli]|uniref:Phage tail protein n=1 Tax=Ignatzschineria cameli TaxID=2182793 RepID=A0A2U2AQP9_9GAMM|nr:putative phage tail protein [Ignatzschineria cameli]PWD86220.1 phage tail protein [Ignatzschineria cameli]PWD88667.1 phage tail protein [Ignatzschineria cameli]PWD89529.1 phage tail protein [Ignatzschineria cameli]PWD90154.1 phage tail protein [Ignatzschineria cameli]